MINQEKAPFLNGIRSGWIRCYQYLFEEETSTIEQSLLVISIRLGGLPSDDLMFWGFFTEAAH